MHARAERWLRTITSLGHHQLKVSYAKSELGDASLGDLAEALNDICLMGEESSAPARDVLTAFVPLIVDVRHLDRVWSIRATASAASLMAVGRMLRASTPDGHLLDRDRYRARPTEGVPQREDGEPLSLGERRALARRPSRASLDLLMRDPHPMVARIVLGNPRITEQDVVRIAACRPALPEIVGEVAKSWCHHARPRITIVLNPGSPPAVSVPLLGLLGRPDLAEVARAADLPPIVRTSAHDLRELRPSLAAKELPELKH